MEAKEKIIELRNVARRAVSFCIATALPNFGLLLCAVCQCGDDCLPDGGDDASEAIPAISIPQMNSLAWAEMVQMDPQTTLPVPVAVAAHTLKIPTFLYRFLLPSPRPEFG